MVTFFISGIISASFQDCGKSEDIIEALIFVSGPKMTGRYDARVYFIFA